MTKTDVTQLCRSPGGESTQRTGEDDAARDRRAKRGGGLAGSIPAWLDDSHIAELAVSAKGAEPR